MRKILPIIAAGEAGREERKRRMKSDKTMEAELDRSVNLLSKDTQRRRKLQLDAEKSMQFWVNNSEHGPLYMCLFGQLISSLSLSDCGMAKAHHEQERMRGEGTEEDSPVRTNCKTSHFIKKSTFIDAACTCSASQWPQPTWPCTEDDLSV